MLVKKTFYFIRHAESEHNAKNLCAGGGIDSPLTLKGKQQALALKDKIANIKFSRIISSPQSRALNTIQLATEQAIMIDRDIREREVGDFEEMPIAEFAAYADTLSHDMALPNGESRHQLSERVLRTVNKHLQTYGDNVLFVSHGIVYWALLEATNQPIYHISNAGLVQFIPQANGWQIKEL